MKITLPLIVLLWPVAAVGQEVRHEMSFPNAAHHEAEISVTYTGLTPEPLEVRMSRSSPGRYALHEFGKNVYNVRAVDGAGRHLLITRPDPYQWDVHDHDGTVTVRYTLFADRGGGTYSQVDETHAHLNMPATFMWARGTGDRPIRVTFRVPAGSGWKAATQLFPTDQAMTFTAPALQYFFDSPTELSDFTLREWPMPAGNRTYTMRLAVHHQGTEAEVDAYAEMVKKVVKEEIAVYGGPAPYDGGTYTFIADYLPYASGDGMEHRNSTIIVSTSSLARNALGLLGTVSHEFFHSWNVERMRPASLEPFNFERANMSRELWFAEGFTSYYAPLFIRRAGLTNDEQFASAVSGNLNRVLTAPGRRFFTPVEMSMQAPFVDAATAIDPNNRLNTFISYYTWGAMIGLNLDLTLRAEKGRSLDEFMRFAWQRFGATEHPYEVEDLQAALGDFLDDHEFAARFFLRYVNGHDLPDYDALLSRAGFALRRRNPNAPFLGFARLGFGDGGALVTSGTTVDSPLYRAGVDRGDRLIALDGHALTRSNDLEMVMGAHRPGDRVTLDFETRAGRRKSETLTLIEDPRMEVVPFEVAGREVTAEVRAFRAAWLGSRADGQ